MAYRGAHPAMPIGGDRDADTGAADKDAALGLAARDRTRERLCEIRIIHGLTTIGSEVKDLESQGFELGNEQNFEIVAGVIGSDCDRLDHTRSYQISGAGASMPPLLASWADVAYPGNSAMQAIEPATG